MKWGKVPGTANSSFNNICVNTLRNLATFHDMDKPPGSVAPTVNHILMSSRKNLNEFSILYQNAQRGGTQRNKVIYDRVDLKFVFATPNICPYMALSCYIVQLGDILDKN